MAFVQSFVRITGGLLISYFKYCNDANLYKLSHVSGEVIVLRDGAFSTISQKDIVPGDVIRVQPGITFCDMVIISSDHIIVDESALTGEATPIAKTEVDKADSERRYLPSEYKLHTVSAGSTVLEACDKSLAVVTKTGSFTTKGELLRDVLSYHRHKFKFDVEVQIVIVILFCYAIFGFSLAVYFLQEVR